MAEEHRLFPIEVVTQLSRKLSDFSSFSRFDSPEHNEADALAHALGDMEVSFRKLLGDVFPKALEQPMSEAQLNDLVGSIRDELRHIVYHIRDVKSFEDLLV